MAEVWNEQGRVAMADAWEVQGRLREHQGGGAGEVRGMRLMSSGLPRVELNAAHVTAADADLEGARAFFIARGVPWGALVPTELPWTAGRRVVYKRLMVLAPAEFRPAPPVPGLELRAAGPGDLAAVAEVDAGAFGEDPAAVAPWLEPHLHAPAVTVVLASLDDAPVGTAYTVRSAGRAGACLHLGGVAVLDAARGRGVGTALSAWLLERGLAGAELAHLNPDDDRAARIYARLGFVEVDGFDIYADL
jgi:GNAT superfamily N-acetyltransferase